MLQVMCDVCRRDVLTRGAARVRELSFGEDERVPYCVADRAIDQRAQGRIIGIFLRWGGSLLGFMENEFCRFMRIGDNMNSRETLVQDLLRLFNQGT